LRAVRADDEWNVNELQDARVIAKHDDGQIVWPKRRCVVRKATNKSCTLVDDRERSILKVIRRLELLELLASVLRDGICDHHLVAGGSRLFHQFGPDACKGVLGCVRHCLRRRNRFIHRPQHLGDPPLLIERWEMKRERQEQILADALYGRASGNGGERSLLGSQPVMEVVRIKPLGGRQCHEVLVDRHVHRIACHRANAHAGGEDLGARSDDARC